MEAALKIGALMVLTIVTSGFIPDRRRGFMISIGLCVLAAVVLHFVAP